MSHISVLVVRASRDVKAEAIAEAIADSVAARPDMAAWERAIKAQEVILRDPWNASKAK